MARKERLFVKDLKEILEQCPDDMMVGTSFWRMGDQATIGDLDSASAADAQAVRRSLNFQESEPLYV